MKGGGSQSSSKVLFHLFCKEVFKSVPKMDYHFLKTIFLWVGRSGSLSLSEPFLLRKPTVSSARHPPAPSSDLRTAPLRNPPPPSQRCATFWHSDCLNLRDFKRNFEGKKKKIPNPPSSFTEHEENVFTFCLGQEMENTIRFNSLWMKINRGRKKKIFILWGI